MFVIKAQVRYRYLNFWLRDTPEHWELMDEADYQEDGNRANDLVHQSAVQEDCVIGGTYWPTRRQRRLYALTYGLHMRDGARLSRHHQEYLHVANMF